MKRQEILTQYKVNKYGIIENFGKFEQCPLYAPYFYDILMNGESDSQVIDDFGCIKDVFNVTQEDIKEFPELKGIKAITVSTSDDGFCLIEKH